ncbi:HmuU protein [Treponema primitia ZAS-2]|uniref:HmuU protein n=2 Tax=Treponema primitia TaxID=88058 RepID=F5YMZ5_TREPZ|nr:HmuU protein [Treponema primitia ZAS-2]
MHPRSLITILLILLPAISLCALAMGRYRVPLPQVAAILANRLLPLSPSWTAQMENVVLNIRLPRIFAAILVGSALGLSGAVYQGMFRNPLVSPDILGVSSGACVGAAAAILYHLGPWAIQLLALAGGLAAVLLTVTIPKLFKNASSLMLVLAGVVVSGFMNALLGAMKYIADPENELAAIVYWTMGSLASARGTETLIMAPGILTALVLVLLLRWRINLLALGDAEAHSLGVNVRALRGLMILCSTTLTALAICLSGTIGWVGLVIPHLGRLLVGQDHQHLLPASALIGAVFMVIVDTLARNISGSEIPLSILTGLLGTPLFIWLLLRQRARIG